MVDIEKLKSIMVKKGINIHELADQANTFTASTLYRMLAKGGGDIKVKQAEEIMNLLDIPRNKGKEIFFAKEAS